MLIAPSDHRIWNPEGEVAWRGEYESYTSIDKYLTCPVIHYKHYSAHGREPVTPAALLGRATHETLAAVLVEKMLRGIDLPLDAVSETFKVKWNVELFLAKNAPGGISWSSLPSPMQLEEKGQSLVRHWARDILPNIDPRGVETSFSVRLKKIDTFLYGRLDLVTPEGFWDHKTSFNNYTPTKEKSFRLQMGIYYVGYLDKYKSWPTDVALTWLKTTGDQEVEVIPYSLTKEDVQQIINEQIRPAMLGIAKSKAEGLWECRCGKHTTVDKRKVVADQTAEAEKLVANAKILDPQKERHDRQNASKTE